MDVDSESSLLRPCRKCSVGVLSASEPERFKNCMACRTKNRARYNSSSVATGTRQKSTLDREGKAKKTTTTRTEKEFVWSSCASGSAIRKPVVKKGARAQRFGSAGALYEDLRSEGMDAVYERYLLEFYGYFESVLQGKEINNKEHVARVAEKLCEIGLLLHEDITEGYRSYDKDDGSMYTRIYSCSCQARDECCGQVKVTAKTMTMCRKTSVRVYHA